MWKRTPKKALSTNLILGIYTSLPFVHKTLTLVVLKCSLIPIGYFLENFPVIINKNILVPINT